MYNYETVKLPGFRQCLLFCSFCSSILLKLSYKTIFQSICGSAKHKKVLLHKSLEGREEKIFNLKFRERVQNGNEQQNNVVKIKLI